MSEALSARKRPGRIKIITPGSHVIRAHECVITALFFSVHICHQDLLLCLPDGNRIWRMKSVFRVKYVMIKVIDYCGYDLAFVMIFFSRVPLIHPCTH